MYQIGDQVLYGMHGVCRITAQEERTVDKKKVSYLILEPLEQTGAKFYIPTHNAAAMEKLRAIMTREELDALLGSESAREDAWIEDENRRKQYYRELINSGDRLRLIRMVVSLHRHKKIQTAAGRKFHLCDENFLRDAQKLLNSEFSVVLNVEPGQVYSYVMEKMQLE